MSREYEGDATWHIGAWMGVLFGWLDDKRGQKGSGVGRLVVVVHGSGSNMWLY